MVKFESEGYCPYNAVASSIVKDGYDKRLIGLWSIIGPSVVCCFDSDHKLEQPCCSTVDHMFSEDPIAFELMKQIILYNANADKIVIKQPFSGASNMQTSSDIQIYLKKVEKPRLVVYESSKYIAIIATESYGIDLYFWDLHICW